MCNSNGKMGSICRYEDCDVSEEKCPLLNEESCSCIQEILKNLAKYEYLEEHRKLVELPCELEDTVFVRMGAGEYAKAEVRDYGYFRTCGFCVVVSSDKFGKKSIPFSEFGKTFFLENPEEIGE